MRGERIQILKMLEEGKITAEEAVKLLESIEGGGPAPASTKPRRMLRIQASEAGEMKVNVNLPVSLAKVALKIAASVDKRLGDIDVDAVIDEIRSGVEGPLVELDDGGDRLVITVE